MMIPYFTVVSFCFLSRSLIVDSAAFAVPPMIQQSQRKTPLSDSRHDTIKGHWNIRQRGGIGKSASHNLYMLPPDMDLLLTNQISETQYNDAIFTLSSSAFSWPSSLLSSAAEQSQSSMSKLIQMMHFFYDCILAVTGIGILNGIFLNRQKEKLGFIEGEEKYMNLKSAMPGLEDYVALQQQSNSKQGLFSVLSTSSTDNPTSQVMTEFENKLLPPAKSSMSTDPDFTSKSTTVDDRSNHKDGAVHPTAGNGGVLAAMFRQELKRRKTIVPTSLDYLTPLQKSFPVIQQSENNSTLNLGDDHLATKAIDGWNEDESISDDTIVDKNDSSAPTNQNGNDSMSNSDLVEAVSDVKSVENTDVSTMDQDISPHPQGDDTIPSRRTNSILNLDLSIKETIEEISKEREMHESVLYEEDLLHQTFPSTNSDNSNDWETTNDNIDEMSLENIKQSYNESFSNEETTKPMDSDNESIVAQNFTEMISDMSSQDNQENDPNNVHVATEDMDVYDESSLASDDPPGSFQPSQFIQDNVVNGTFTTLDNDVQLDHSEIQLEEITNTNMAETVYDNQEYNDIDYIQDEMEPLYNQESNTQEDPVSNTMLTDEIQYSSFDNMPSYNDDDDNDFDDQDDSIPYPTSSSTTSYTLDEDQILPSPSDQTTSWTEISTPAHVSEDDFKMAQGLAKAAFHAELKKQSTAQVKRIDHSDYKAQVENDMKLVREYAKQKNILKSVARAQGDETNASELLKRLAEVERRRKFESIGLIDPRLYGPKMSSGGMSSGRYERPMRYKEEIQQEEEPVDGVMTKEDQSILGKAKKEDFQQRDDTETEIKKLEASLPTGNDVSDQKRKTNILTLAKKRPVIFAAAAIVIGRRLVSLWFGGGLLL